MHALPTPTARPIDRALVADLRRRLAREARAPRLTPSDRHLIATMTAVLDSLEERA